MNCTWPFFQTNCSDTFFNKIISLNYVFSRILFRISEFTINVLEIQFHFGNIFVTYPNHWLTPHLDPWLESQYRLKFETVLCWRVPLIFGLLKLGKLFEIEAKTISVGRRDRYWNFGARLDFRVTVRIGSSRLSRMPNNLWHLQDHLPRQQRQ